MSVHCFKMMTLSIKEGTTCLIYNLIRRFFFVAIQNFNSLDNSGNEKNNFPFSVFSFFFFYMKNPTSAPTD